MEEKSGTRKRIIVITDISSMESGYLEPDDTESMVRFLLYTNEWDVEGLIACAYGEHGTRPEYIHKVIDAYEKVLPNLRLHDKAYPNAEALHSVVKTGNGKIGIENLGEGHDTEGSDWILSVLDKPDPRPVWVLLWGGPLDLAQAVYKASKTKTKEAFQTFKEKLRVYAIGDQYDTTGPWIKKNYPDIFYITNYKAFRGMYRHGEEYLSGSAWVQEHVKDGHGALGDIYPVYHGGDPWGAVEGMKEGDTPSFLYLIPNGLNCPEHPEWGSWGGSFYADQENGAAGRQFTDIVSTNAAPVNTESDGQNPMSEPDTVSADIESGSQNTVSELGTASVDTESDGQNPVLESDTAFVAAEHKDPAVSIYRYREAFQADFQARLDCCTKPYAECNHPPVLEGMEEIVHINARPGEPVILDAGKVIDPDGDSLTFTWEIYQETGTYRKETVLLAEKGNSASVILPKPGSFSVVLSVTDNGVPALTRYRRYCIHCVSGCEAI